MMLQKNGIAREYFSDVELAEILGLSFKTLRRWRLMGRGPSYVKAGSRVLYPRKEFEKWAAERLVTPGGGGA